MKEQFQCINRQRGKRPQTEVAFLGKEKAAEVQKFHSSFEQYEETPLRELDALAKVLGVAGIYLKDESYRFGLNAFKVLGGSHAMGRYVAQKLGMDIGDLPYSVMTSGEVHKKVGQLTFVTATDGNHGRGVAWTAKRLGQKAVVYMPKGSAVERLENIRAEGAEASITDLNYDDAVRLANRQAEEKGWVMVQDTAWEGYTDIPTWIMQGYGTMAYEADGQLAAQNLKPTHIFIQAGVGSLAGAVQGYFAAVYGEDRPITVVVEPNKADCLYRTAKADDGTLHFVTDDMNTIMAGLACGEPCTIGWEVLHSYADAFVSCPDYVSAQGMRILGNPLGEDMRVVSGESGAVTTGLLAEIMAKPDLGWMKEVLKLDENSRVLVFSTEGDTDRKNYRSIVWDGKYPRQ